MFTAVCFVIVWEVLLLLGGNSNRFATGGERKPGSEGRKSSPLSMEPADSKDPSSAAVFKLPFESNSPVGVTIEASFSLCWSQMTSIFLLVPRGVCLIVGSSKG